MILNDSYLNLDGVTTLLQTISKSINNSNQIIKHLGTFSNRTLAERESLKYVDSNFILSWKVFSESSNYLRFYDIHLTYISLFLRGKFNDSKVVTPDSVDPSIRGVLLLFSNSYILIRNIYFTKPNPVADEWVTIDLLAHPDWNQNNPDHAEYIKNKPDLNNFTTTNITASDTIRALRVYISDYVNSKDIRTYALTMAPIDNSINKGITFGCEEEGFLWRSQEEGNITNTYLPYDASQWKADWNETDTTSISFIKNKPNLETPIFELTTVREGFISPINYLGGLVISKDGMELMPGMSDVVGESTNSIAFQKGNGMLNISMNPSSTGTPSLILEGISLNEDQTELIGDGKLELPLNVENYLANWTTTNSTSFGYIKNKPSTLVNLSKQYAIVGDPTVNSNLDDYTLLEAGDDGRPYFVENPFKNDGEPTVVPIMHPDLSTQDQILPQRFGGQNIKERVIMIDDYFVESLSSVDFLLLPSGSFVIGATLTLWIDGTGTTKSVDVMFYENLDGMRIDIPELWEELDREGATRKHRGFIIIRYVENMTQSLFPLNKDLFDHYDKYIIENNTFVIEAPVITDDDIAYHDILIKSSYYEFNDVLNTPYAFPSFGFYKGELVVMLGKTRDTTTNMTSIRNHSENYPYKNMRVEMYPLKDAPSNVLFRSEDKYYYLDGSTIKEYKGVLFNTLKLAFATRCDNSVLVNAYALDADGGNYAYNAAYGQHLNNYREMVDILYGGGVYSSYNTGMSGVRSYITMANEPNPDTIDDYPDGAAPVTIEYPIPFNPETGDTSMSEDVAKSIVVVVSDNDDTRLGGGYHLYWWTSPSSNIQAGIIFHN